MAKHLTTISWSETPHLDESAQRGLLSAFMPHERDARTKGIPSLGSGAIYPVVEEDVTIEPFIFPAWYRHVFALDVGWNRTAAIWGALDADTDVLYLYAEYYRGQVEPAVHAAAIKGRGDWIPGVVDPASRGRSQKDGEQLFSIYTGLGLNLTPANNAREAGLLEVWQRLSTGRLKIFRTMPNTLAEYRIYRRDEKGQIVKENDHLMDACVVADTRVVTPSGPVRIADLCGKTGKVMTIGGAWADYKGARLIFKNAPTVEVVFEDGRSVRCTPDHPFLTPGGWKRADCMHDEMCYDGVSQRIQWTNHTWIPSFSLQPLKSLVARATTAAASIFVGSGASFTEWCGKTLGVPFPTTYTSTTSITTPQTTPSPTFRSFRGPSIPATTNSGISAASRLLLWTQRVLGTGQTPVTSGIKCTTKPMPIGFIARVRMYASSAANRMRLRPAAPTGSVRTTVKARRASSLASTTKNACASYAAQFLWQTAIWLKKPAAGPAARNCLVRCVAVFEKEPADVYCLTVPGTSAFAVEGGLIVHNTRYLVVSGLSVATVRPFEEWAGRPGMPQLNKQRKHESEHNPFAGAWGVAAPANAAAKAPHDSRMQGWMPGALR